MKAKKIDGHTIKKSFEKSIILDIFQCYPSQEVLLVRNLGGNIGMTRIDFITTFRIRKENKISNVVGFQTNLNIK